MGPTNVVRGMPFDAAGQRSSITLSDLPSYFFPCMSQAVSQRSDLGSG